MHIQFSVPHRCSEKDAQLGLCEHSNEAVPAAPGKPQVPDCFEKEDIRNISLNWYFPEPSWRLFGVDVPFS